MREVEEALREVARTGTEVSSPMTLGVVADSFREIGRYGEALVALEAGLAISARTGQAYWDADLCRIEGEVRLLREPPEPKAAERLFQRALELSRSQKAKALELRAGIRLARLWQGRGERERARELIAPLYASFSEGFDSPDLEEAKALVGVLS